MAVFTPVSLINAVFYIYACPQAWVIVCSLITAVCAFCLTVRHGKPLSLKILALVTSILLILPLGSLGLAALLLGNVAQNTVVMTLPSPGGDRYAQVIDSDQGELGGNILVDVYTKGDLDLLLFKVSKKAQRVYVGEWREYETMDIHWKTNNTLVIDASEYRIK